jgi:hypothetical protein
MSLAQTFDASFRDELDELGQRLVARMKEYLRREGKVASGELLRSLEYEVTEDKRLLFRATADHAIFVHEGTRGHWAPPGALEGWVQTVGFAPGLSIESRDYLARKSVAEGTEATPFIQEPLEERAVQIARNLETRLLQDLRSEADATTDG